MPTAERLALAMASWLAPAPPATCAPRTIFRRVIATVVNVARLLVALTILVVASTLDLLFALSRILLIPVLFVLAVVLLIKLVT